jgi:cell division septum initiation protein DivIVA
MMPMILAAALSMVYAQDKTPATKTVEERLKELEEKLTRLEKRNQAIALENQAMELRIAETKAAKEALARQIARGWVQRYAKPLELTEKQSAELEELWVGWTRADFEKASDPAGWTSREEVMKGKLTSEQVSGLARAVRDEQEKLAKMSLSGLLNAAKVAPDHEAALEKAVLARVTFAADTLLPQAHPERQVGWLKILGALEASMADLDSVLGDDEKARLRDTFAKWKPRK